MRLTQKNAHLYVGKKIDAHKRLFHYYPLEVKIINGKYAVKDSVGVCQYVPPEEERFNVFYFDFVVED